ncbi:MAG: methyltransferase domain-containing protein [Cytophagales bacterium]
MNKKHGEIKYDKYYEAENLFGAPCKELIEYFAKQPIKGKVIDLGCGQGRNAIALTRLGFNVLGIDISKTGIGQMMKIAESEKLALTGQVGDIYSFEEIEKYDFILLDSMFHFAKNDKKQEINLLKKILDEMKGNSKMVICNQDTGQKIKFIKEIFEINGMFKGELEQDIEYVFHDSISNHKSVTPYKILVFHKLKASMQ